MNQTRLPGPEWSADMRARMAWDAAMPKSSAPAEPPMSPSGKSYYTPGDDPREGQDPLAKKDGRRG